MSDLSITLTETAADALRAHLEDETGPGETGPGETGPGETGIVLIVGPDFSVDMSIGSLDDAVTCESNGITIFVPTESADRAHGIRIDYRMHAQGFAIENPNAPKVMDIDPRDLQEQLNKGEVQEFVDVRTDREWAIAHIEGAKLMDPEYRETLQSLNKDTALAFV